MAQDSVLSLFGNGPLQLQKQRQEEDIEFGRKANGLSGYMGYAGRQLGRSVAASPLFGGSDPELERATKIKAATERVKQAGINLGDPDAVYPAAIQELQKEGLIQEAMMASQAWQKIKDERAKEVRENRKVDIDAGKLEVDQKTLTNNSHTKAGEDFVKVGRALGIPARLHLADYTEEESARILAELERIENAKAAAGADRQNFNLGNNEFDKQAAKDAAKRNVEIDTGYEALGAIQEAVKTLSQGMYTGFWGPTQEKIAEASGGTVGDMEKVRNTQTFRSLIGQVIIPKMQAFGGNDSNEELKYLRSIMAGETNLDAGAMQRILERAEQALRNDIIRKQKQQEAIAPSSKLPTAPVGNQPSVNNPATAPVAAPKATMRWDGTKLVPAQ